MALYTVAGLSQKVDLPVPLIVKLIPPSQKNQRPGIPRQRPGYWVQHETANYNVGAGAEMHWRYLANGAEGQTLSFHFAVDDHVIYQMIPIDEVTWQAADGAGPGNMSGISSELCVNRDADWTKARHNAEALAGGVLKALGMGVDRCKRHWDFNFADPNRHHCPDKMMTEGYWPTFVANVGKIIGATAAEQEEPVNNDNGYVPGMDEGIASMLFGKITDDKGVYQFNPNGPVSKAWLAHGRATGEWPELKAVRSFDDGTAGRTYFVFEGGWTLWRAGNGPVAELK